MLITRGLCVCDSGLLLKTNTFLQGPLPAWDKNVHYIMSQDFFKSNHEKIASCGNKFDILAHRVSSSPEDPMFQ